MILIRNVKIIDGSGSPAYPGDVLISGGKISAIGHFPNRKAETIIEGLGAYLTPGFIDIQSEADHYLKIFTNPSQNQYLAEGITTIIGGHSGASLAPLLYGSLRTLHEYTNPNQINVNWHSFEELVKELNKLPLGVNFGSFIGHSTIRQELNDDENRDLTDPEINVFKRIIREALEQGAFGLSTGPDTARGRRVPQHEIRELLSEAADKNGIYSVRLRNNKDDLVNTINEIIFLYQNSGVKTIINNFQPLAGFDKQYQLALQLIEKNGDGIFFTVSPELSRTVTARQLLPEWAQAENLEEMDQKRIINQIKIPDEVIIEELPSAYRYLQGKTLKEFAKNRKLPLGQALLELIRMTKMRLVVSLTDVSEKLLSDWLTHDRALITAPVNKFFEIAENQRWPLEKAVAKLTSFPARVLGLKNRGLIKENFAADLVLIKDKKIQTVLVNGNSGGEAVVL